MKRVKLFYDDSEVGVPEGYILYHSYYHSSDDWFMQLFLYGSYYNESIYVLSEYYIKYLYNQYLEHNRFRRLSYNNPDLVVAFLIGYSKKKEEKEKINAIVEWKFRMLTATTTSLEVEALVIRRKEVKARLKHKVTRFLDKKRKWITAKRKIR